jgi:mono/diheme cytochrome c family protein
MFTPGEMNTLLSYLWADQLFGTTGDAARGKTVFREKSCAACHEAGRAVRIAGKFSTPRMTAVLWNHGPVMLEQMKRQAIPWPRFSEKDMVDLVAHLNSLP